MAALELKLKRLQNEQKLHEGLKDSHISVEICRGLYRQLKTISHEIFVVGEREMWLRLFQFLRSTNEMTCDMRE